jgi:phosphatidate cytidylyltransferase
VGGADRRWPDGNSGGGGLWWITPFAPWQAALLALAIVVSGFLGGLVLSAVKRSLGAKDWGTMIEAMAGCSTAWIGQLCRSGLFHLVNYFFAV